MKKLAMVLVLLTAASACANPFDTTVKGYTGFARSESGTLQIWVNPCGLEVSKVHVSGPIEQLNSSQMANKFDAKFESTETTGKDLAELTPGEVIVGKNERWTPEEFASCAPRFRYPVATASAP